MVGGDHLLVQAGTGTGKSLAYLVPSLLHDSRVVVATATLALQHQLVERDLPRLVEAVGDLPGVDASYAVLKGRSNYACLHRIREGVPDDQGTLDRGAAGLDGHQGARAARLGRGGGRGAAAAASATTRRGTPTASGARSRSATASASAPRSARSAQECFAELAREKAQRSHLVVTNHSLLAIDAIEGVPMIPDYDVGGHRRGPRAASPGHPGRHRRAVRRRRRPGGQAVAATRRGHRGRRPRRRRRRAAATRSTTLDPGRIDTPARRARRRPGAGARRRARLPVGLPQGRRRPATATPGSPRPRASVQEVFATAERMAADSRVRRALAGRGRRPAAAAALRRAAPGVGADARQAAHRQDRRSSPARRCCSAATSARWRRASGSSRPSWSSTAPVAATTERSDGRAALARPRRRQPVRLRPAGDPLRRPPPAAARPRRPRRGPARRDRRAGRRRRGPHPRAVLQPAGGRDRGRGGPRAAART